jgi:hypothetical protein
MEQEIKRMRYYDGLFLKEGEFIDEQKYHLHMRRRINFALYHYGVMGWYRGGLKVTREGDTGTRIRVNSGMALDRNSETMESREIILREPQIIDLSASAYPDFTGQKVYITIKYKETESADPPSEGPVPGNTRIVESAEITATADPPARPLSPFEVADNVEEVILATVDYNSMAVDEVEREYGGIGFENLTKDLQDIITAPSAPNLVSINIAPSSAIIPVGGNRSFGATGIFDSGPSRPLGPADGLAWRSEDDTIATVTAADGNGIATGISPTPPDAPIRIFGEVGSISGSSDVVVAPAPIFTSFNPPGFGGPGANAVINGQNFNYPELQVSFSPLPANPQQPGVVAQINRITPAQIECRVPSGAKTGPVRIITVGGFVDSSVPWGVP